MLFEALCIIGAGIVAKKAIENPDKTKKIVNSFAKTAERSARNGNGNMDDYERSEFINQCQRLQDQTSDYDE